MTIEKFLEMLNNEAIYCPSCGESIKLGMCQCLEEMALAEDEDEY